MAQYILNNSGFTFFFKGRPKSVPKGTTQYAKILKAFDLPADQQDSAISDILDGDKVAAKEAELAGFSFKGNDVYVDGELLPQVLIDKINSLKREGLPITLFLNFWRNLKENPDFVVVNDRGFYDFLQYAELPITEDGYFIAYKGVDKNLWSVMGNKATKVTKGKVNSGGHIFNGVGEQVSVVRNGVSTNRKESCSMVGSLHCGSYNYASGWGSRTLVVKINPKDVVSVPFDCECQKLRVCAYEVLSELDREILAPATDSRGEVIENQDKSEQEIFEKRIQAYLNKKYSQGFAAVSVQQIRNIFSPDYPDSKRVLAAVDNLGYVWVKEKCGSIWVNLR
jgi:hypothetical protein